jgi:putative DNA primase/helicase
LPFAYDPEARCDNWLVSLESIFEEDQERIALLQEWFGYCLTPDTSYHSFMLFEGESRAGKGTIKNVLVKLIGCANVSSVRLEMLGERFQLYPTYGKLVNVIDETDRVERFDEGLFKTLVAGGEVSFERKGKDNFSEPATARILILANEKPPIFDRSEGMWNRMLLIPFHKTFKDREDRGLEARLSLELPGIFNWALAGRQRLYKQERFTLPAISKVEREQYKLESNPARHWLTDNYLPKAGALRVVKTALYAQYVHYCKENGFRPLSSITFNREVKRTFPDSTEFRQQECGERVRYWKGIIPAEDGGHTF